MHWYWDVWFINEDGSGWRLYGLHIGRAFIGVSFELEPMPTNEDKVE